MGSKNGAHALVNKRKVKSNFRSKCVPVTACLITKHLKNLPSMVLTDPFSPSTITRLSAITMPSFKGETI